MAGQPAARYLASELFVTIWRRGLARVEGT